MSSPRPSGWSQAPPWRGRREPIFTRVARSVASQPSVRWLELSLRDDLLTDPWGDGRKLVRVSARKGKAGGAPPPDAPESSALPRWLGNLAPGEARRERSPRGADRKELCLAYALRLDGRLAGLWRLCCEGATADEAAIGLLVQRGELWLERDLLTRRLDEARAHYRTILEAAGDGILIVDARTSRVVEANRRAAILSRYREADLVGRLLWTLLGNATEALPRRLLDPSAEGGGRLPGSRAGASGESRPILRLLRRRGEPLPVAVTFARVPGPHPLLHLILSDVSSEERARRELLQAKETLGAIAVAAVRLQTPVDRGEVFEVLGRELARLGYLSAVLLPGAPGGSWEVTHLRGPPGSVEPPPELLGAHFDPARLAPLRRALSTGRSAFSDRPAEDLKALLATLRASEAASLSRRLGFRGVVVAPMGQDVATSGALLVAGSGLRAVDAEGIDAFARQAGMALERARLYGELRQRSAGLEVEVDRRTRELTLAVRALREIDRRKDNFLANVSHELRTPLVTILGYTQLVLGGRMGPLTAQQQSCLQTSHRNAQRLKEFIEELLDFSRHELTRESLRPEPFDVRLAVDQASAALYPRLLERGLSLRSRVARGTPPVFGERDRVVQVLSNLLFNAERHCQPGGWLRIAVAGVNGRVRISVADDGVGIAPEHRDRIFDRLYQVGDRAAAREKGAGLGLGLAIAKSIVEAHGGKIWIDGRPRRGSRFRFELPSAKNIVGPVIAKEG